MQNIARSCKQILRFSENILTYKYIHNFSSVKNHLCFKNYHKRKCLQMFERKFSDKNNTDIINNDDKLTCNEDIDDQKNIEDFSELTGGDPTLEKKLQVLMLEAEVHRQEGQKVPSAEFLKAYHWKELLALKSISARRKYFAFLFKVENKRKNAKLKKQTSSEKLIENRQNNEQFQTEDGHLKYGLSGNTIFIRIYDTTINQQLNRKLINAMMFGQQIVIDCGYDMHMTTQEQNNTAKQLMLLFAENRAHNDPFDLHYCNANMKGRVMGALHRFIPTLLEPEFPLNVHQESYYDLFPKEKLVYLTPHCRQELTEYNHDDIYIIGAMVDKANHEPLSMAKAKKENLRMARLPLDRYLQWNAGSGKSLTLNQVVAILLDIKSTGDWPYALRHVPRRKIIDPEEYILNDNVSKSFDRKNKSNFKKYQQKHYDARQKISNVKYDYSKSDRNKNREMNGVKKINIAKIMK